MASHGGIVKAGIGALPGHLVFEPPPAAGVELFEEQNFTGASIKLGIGHHLLQGAPDLERAASSIKVPAGLVAMLHDEGDSVAGYGRYVDLLEDHTELGSLNFDKKTVYVDVFSSSQTTTVAAATVRDHRAIPPTAGPVVPESKFVWARNAIVSDAFVAGHWVRPPASGDVAEGPAVVSPDPMPPNLLQLVKLDGSPWENPDYDTTGASWSSDLVDGHTFDGSNDHPYEWVNILDPTVQQDDQVGATGVVVEVDDSDKDIPVTHWFGGDWEFGMVPDPQFERLLAPSNRDPKGEYGFCFEDAHKMGLAVPAGIMPMEVDGRNIPDDFKADPGDRVAMVGRWIIDAGHDDFHSEIHPPLLLATQQVLDDSGNRTALSPNASVGFKLWTRPYQVNQRFHTGDDSNLCLKDWATDISESTSIEAYPQIFDKPFDGVNLISLLVNPPPPPVGHGAAGAVAIHPHELRCSYQFITNGAVGLEVRPAPAGGGVIVHLAFNSVNYPTNVPLPNETGKDYDIQQLLDQVPGGADLNWLESAWLSIQGDVKIYTYDAPAMPAHTNEHVVPYTALAHLPPSTVVTDAQQAFPIYGWLKLKWFETAVVATEA